MVFHTTPPQPASNARCAWYPVLAGGPEATQNGLGDLMPARLVERSAMTERIGKPLGRGGSGGNARGSGGIVAAATFGGRGGRGHRHAGKGDRRDAITETGKGVGPQRQAGLEIETENL